MLLNILIKDALACCQLAAVSEAHAAPPRPPVGDPLFAPPHAAMQPILLLSFLEAALWTHTGRRGCVGEGEVGWMRAAERAPCLAAWHMQYLATPGMGRGDLCVHLQLCLLQSYAALLNTLTSCD